MSLLHHTNGEMPNGAALELECSVCFVSNETNGKEKIKSLVTANECNRLLYFFSQEFHIAIAAVSFGGGCRRRALSPEPERSHTFKPIKQMELFFIVFFVSKFYELSTISRTKRKSVALCNRFFLFATAEQTWNLNNLFHLDLLLCAIYTDSVETMWTSSLTSLFCFCRSYLICIRFYDYDRHSASMCADCGYLICTTHNKYVLNANDLFAPI